MTENNCVAVNFSFFYIVISQRKFCLTRFWQKFRESNLLLNKLLKSCFHEIFFSVWENISFFYRVHLSLTFFSGWKRIFPQNLSCQKIRQIVRLLWFFHCVCVIFMTSFLRNLSDFLLLLCILFLMEDFFHENDFT